MPEVATTKTQTLKRRQARIPLRTLPRTFRDAIIVARSLGLHFLWVDSLCIIQDSAEDWQHESAMMGKVYSHAYCTIAASAARNCDEGLFATHLELPLLPPTRDQPGVLFKPLYTGWDGIFRRSTLIQRGWTLQERELSPRMLYFTKNTMLFECREARISDRDHVPGHNEWSSKSSISRDASGPNTTLRCLDKNYNTSVAGASHELAVAKHYDLWRNMVQDYASRELTHRTDKFPALSGLAREFAYMLDDEYVAGLWRKDLLKGLCWKWSSNRTRPQSTSNYEPSWSWAKMNVPITYELVRDDKIVRQKAHEKESVQISQDSRWIDPIFLHVSIIPEGRDKHGTLISGKIFLEGQILPLERSKAGDIGVNGDFVKLVFDHLPQPPADLFLLSLGSTNVGLVLELAENGIIEYRRVGVLTPIVWEWFENVEFSNVTLT